jgi:hypothetical protein
MKVTIGLDLSDEDDKRSYNLIHQAANMHSALWEYSQWLRDVCKHGDPDAVNAEACKDKFWELMGENDVVFE